MEENNKKIDEIVFGYRFIKKICVFAYFLFLAINYTLLIWYLRIEISSRVIDALHVFLIVSGFFITPIILIIILYPLYALAYISENTKKLIDGQEVIETLIAKKIIDDKKD